MISISAFGQDTDVFKQVAVDLTRYIHFGGYDVIDEIVDRSYIPVEKIEKFFEKNPDLLPDAPVKVNDSSNSGLFRAEKVNELTFDAEYDFVRGDNRGYMTLVLQFVYDTVESYVTVEIQDIRNNK